MLAESIFTTPLMEALFSDVTELRFMLAFESALAAAQADVGVIPTLAATTIADVCQQTDWDTEQIRQQTLLAGNPAIPFVNLLKERIGWKSPESVRYVHWGATSQDVIDTALMCQLKQALEQLRADLDLLNRQLTTLAHTHQHTPMMGRTLLQQALPITFADKVMGWLDGLLRSVDRLDRIMKECIVLQLGGPVGNAVTLGVHSLAIREKVATTLGLGTTKLTWHTQRDQLADIAAMLGILNGSLGKLANDVILLMQTEVGEVREGAAEGKGGSSSMPHKRNPVTSTFMVAIAHRTPALVASLLGSMMQPHERAAGAWHSEWPVIRDVVKLTAANLHYANDLIGSLEVDTERMQQNLKSTN
ncbi:3-carboxy-cis,cis-muconate cycloisomerase [Spirosoma endbachense]|uniref:3-carboxy-cis,cis-muconate cycloisomerase n=1 Tax=Spirosoma endbachense TaxID=2666025 RepID=A0A6P1W8V0_9BACT|nr:3-carboxy-cis,cis-muconate cycloisomerase [Spirosoma endbachense]QHW00450.1 3-carboxy-cis,cis-muconate cycloisomerase [Spirosoma endbachense]